MTEKVRQKNKRTTWIRILCIFLALLMIAGSIFTLIDLLV